LRFEALERAGDKKIQRRGKKDQPQKPPVPARVEEITDGQQPELPQRIAAEQPVDGKDRQKKSKKNETR
jgi:hypothetical protein